MVHEVGAPLKLRLSESLDNPFGEGTVITKKALVNTDLVKLKSLRFSVTYNLEFRVQDEPANFRSMEALRKRSASS